MCEVEDTVSEWVPLPYIREHSLTSHLKRPLDIDTFKPSFEVGKVELGGIDFGVWRVGLRAKREGRWEQMGIGVRVVDGHVVNEVKRRGLLIDRGRDLEVRVGDEVVVYVSMGGYER